jgi:O-acetyl-ADP-ribose deacetylase (regulator of RNase III)
MIKVNKGNLLDVTSGIIVHGVNSCGVMGSGVALAIKRKYPDCYDMYKRKYYNNGLYLGEVIWYTHSYSSANRLYIANAVTQENYGREGKRYVNYKAVVDCFTEIIGYARTTGCDIHFPAVGAGLGGGDWSIIEQLINDCDPDDKVSKNLWVLE